MKQAALERLWSKFVVLQVHLNIYLIYIEGIAKKYAPLDYWKESFHLTTPSGNYNNMPPDWSSQNLVHHR